jgi:hypothetical protein
MPKPGVARNELRRVAAFDCYLKEVADGVVPQLPVPNNMPGKNGNLSVFES